MSLEDNKYWRSRPFFPPSDVYRSTDDEPFLNSATCTVADFLHPEFQKICALLEIPGDCHRKVWEWVFIVEKLRKSGALWPGKRGLGFGIGSERLPALFAEMGAFVTATDAPPDIGEAGGWTGGNQLSSGLDSIPRLRLNAETFRSRVEFFHCDMNNISQDFRDYDFCWSSCALEHLGTLRAGINFIINSVEQTLKIGGVAVHTTEFNCSSNGPTMEEGWTVLYRRRDIDSLVDELRERGHQVDEVRIDPGRYAIDGYVDAPPYGVPHLKLELEGYVTTSIGLVIRRGR